MPNENDTCPHCLRNIFPGVPVSSSDFHLDFCSSECAVGFRETMPRCSSCGAIGPVVLCDNGCGYGVCDSCEFQDHPCDDSGPDA